MVRTAHSARRRALASGLISGALLATLIGSALPVAADDGDALLPITHEKLSLVDPLVVTGAQIGAVGTRNIPNPICTTTTSTASNVNTDCDAAAPHNETTLAVNPNNSDNMIGGANDYQLSLSPGGTVYETIHSRAHVTFDGGSTWTEWKLTNQNAYTSTGDPAIAFDATGRAYYATLGFTWSQNRFCCTNPDVVVETSTDGGRHWTNEHRVASGTGEFSSPGRFNDKEYIAAWGIGNAIVTWTVFNDGLGGSYLSSPIYDSVTHDGGVTWSARHQISGSAAFCVGAQGGTSCNQDQFSTPAVAADGSVYVSFINYSEPTPVNGRDQYLVVQVDPATGAKIAGPYRVGTVFDGFTDYPISIDGRQTLQDSEFRTNPAGNLAADPTDADHLALVWSDMRNGGAGSAGADPYTVTTNSDVIVSETTDAGLTWSSPAALVRTKDQFQPWSAFDSAGDLVIGAFDRHYDNANHRYGYSLYNGGWTQLTTALSNPTSGDRWFSGRTPNPDFPHPSTFIGDYSGIAVSGTTAYGYWTDLRNNVFFPNRTGHGEDAYFGR